MNNKASATGLLGLGLLGAYVWKSQDGAVLRAAVTETQGNPPSDQAHKALVKFFGALAFVLFATFAATASDSAGTAFIAFFLLLWVVWGMKFAPLHSGSGSSQLQNKLGSSFTNKGKP